jgi:hypothetical protein
MLFVWKEVPVSVYQINFNRYCSNMLNGFLLMPCGVDEVMCLSFYVHWTNYGNETSSTVLSVSRFVR